MQWEFMKPSELMTDEFKKAGITFDANRDSFHGVQIAVGETLIKIRAGQYSGITVEKQVIPTRTVYRVTANCGTLPISKDFEDKGEARDLKSELEDKDEFSDVALTEIEVPIE